MRVFGSLSEEEREIHDSIRRLKSVLGNGANLQELCAGRQEIQEAYGAYFSCNSSTYKVYFHARLKELRIGFDSRIKDLEEAQGLQ